MKRCSKCGEEKPLDQFFKCANTKTGRQAACKVCSQRASKEWRRNNRERSNKLRRDSRLRVVYGLEEAEFHALIDRQSGRCAICQTTFVTTPCVDHCHTTGKIRGVLCASCNRGIGLLKDSSAVLRSAAEYIEAHDA